MSDAALPVPPEWVVKRDGQLVPFESDKICRSLFAAAESLDRADPFLARELTDSVVHFLAVETEGSHPSTLQIAEVVAKVVRELGHPALAAAYAQTAESAATAKPMPETESRPARKTKAEEFLLRLPRGRPFTGGLRLLRREYALQAIFTRDLVALERDGLLLLGGLDRPTELAGSVVDLSKAADLDNGLLQHLEGSLRRGSGTVVLDGPEYLLAPPWPASKPFAPGFARRLENALRLAGVRGIANLNQTDPPAWASESAGSPLFQSTRAHAVGVREDQADQLAREWTSQLSSAVRVDWHLNERDFTSDAVAQERLLDRLLAAVRGANLAFVFDRPRRPLALAEGMNRRRGAVLLDVGLHLPRLADLTGTTGEPDRFLRKLASLTRLALSAGVQKREFLRRQIRSQAEASATGLNSGFVLDRAAVIVVPVGLDHLVQKFTGLTMPHGGQAQDFARAVVQTIRDIVRESARSDHPEACLDSALDGNLGEGDGGAATGLTTWDESAALINQLRAGGLLHGMVEGGTLFVLVREDDKPNQTNLLDALRFAWEKTELVRLRFLRTATTQKALPFRE